MTFPKFLIALLRSVKNPLFYQKIVILVANTFIMMRLSTLLLIATFSLGLGACSKNLSYLHRDTVQDSRMLDRNMDQIQFYLSQELILERSLSQQKSEIKDGRIIVEEGGEVDRIRIPAESPGVFIFSPDGEKMAISFSDDEDSYLMFGPNPNENNRYTLLGKNWKRDYGEVTFRGKTYYVNRRSAMTGLLVDLKYTRKTKESRETLRGRTIN